jgi:hypothetical protein
MNKKVTTILCGAGVGAALLLAAPTAGADPSTTNNTNDWGQSVAACNAGAASCGGGYQGGTNRGAYVSGQAQQNNANGLNGFGTNIHTGPPASQFGPANPGNSAGHSNLSPSKP